MTHSHLLEDQDLVGGVQHKKSHPATWLRRFTHQYGLVLTLSHHGSVTYNRQTLRVGRGDLLLLKPSYQHRFLPEEQWEYIWFHFLPRPHVLYALEWQEKIPGVGIAQLDQPDFLRVKRALLEAWQLETQRPEDWYHLAILLLESALIRGWRQQHRNASSPANEIAQIQARLLQHDCSIDAIAKRCGMSRSAFYAKFRAATGCSPQEYRELTQMRRAAHLLEQSGLPIREIAEQVGMADPLYFSTRFRKFSGWSPRAYRQRNASEKQSQQDPSG